MKQYKILSRSRKSKEDFWIVTYEVWEGCYCTKQKKEAKIYKESIPLMKDLLKVV